jgi:hypothetical protein
MRNRVGSTGYATRSIDQSNHVTRSRGVVSSRRVTPTQLYNLIPVGMGVIAIVWGVRSIVQRRALTQRINNRRRWLSFQNARVTTPGFTAVVGVFFVLVGLVCFVMTYLAFTGVVHMARLP